jgi:hypothetical protein
MAKVCIEQGDDGGLKLGIPAEKTPFVYLETRKELLTDDGLPICDFTKFDDRRPLLAACLLLIQGDFPVIYSMRRQWVRDGKLVNLKRELDLIRLVLSKHRKSISGWNYR